MPRDPDVVGHVAQDEPDRLTSEETSIRDRIGGVAADQPVATLQSGNPAVTPVHLDVGARLTREWKGVRYEVEVAEGGYLHAGERYGSLSEVARVITGTRWNGLRFLGLRNEVAS